MSQIAEPAGPGLFPPIEPYDQGLLDVGDGHRIYWERVGQRGARPAVFIHGGPGGSVEPFHRQLFDPDRYDVLLFDQRGCGRSRPRGSLDANSTPHLVADLEALRQNIMATRQWLVVGGSWGSLLGLAYAQRHPEAVDALILRGLFLGSHEEMDWFYRSGLDHIFPDKWARLLAIVPEDQRADLLTAYTALLNDPDSTIARRAAREWARFEREISSLDDTLNVSPPNSDEELASARLQVHFFRNGCFVEPGQLLDGVRRLVAIPAVLIHGRYDMACPLKFAWEVHNAWPEAEFHVVPAAGHSGREPGVMAAMLAAIQRFSAR